MMNLNALSAKAKEITRTGALALCLPLLLSSPAWAAKPTQSRSPISEVRIQIERDLREWSGSTFEPLTQKWQKDFGSEAVTPLLELAGDSAQKDSTRYIALLSATRLGGASVIPQLARLLKADSWMIRSAALQAVRATRASELAFESTALLRDPALAVRTEAVLTVGELKAKGWTADLLATLEDPTNYHGGRAQWVPLKVLDVLAQGPASLDVLPALAKLLDRKDPVLQERTVLALERIRFTDRNSEGDIQRKPYTEQRPLAEKIRYWKTSLARK